MRKVSYLLYVANFLKREKEGDPREFLKRV